MSIVTVNRKICLDGEKYVERGVGENRRGREERKEKEGRRWKRSRGGERDTRRRKEGEVGYRQGIIPQGFSGNAGNSAA